MQKILLDMFVRKLLPQIAVVAAGATLAVVGLGFTEDCIRPLSAVTQKTE